ncbi:MAG: hypothetical protein IPL22_04940 [Bacteroidetes bacterium]|nr:hypothetical protein [Bacteroidota bacterium]
MALLCVPVKAITSRTRKSTTVKPRPFTSRDGDSRPRRDEDAGERKPYARRDESSTDRKPFARRDDDRGEENLMPVVMKVALIVNLLPDVMMIEAKENLMPVVMKAALIVNHLQDVMMIEAKENLMPVVMKAAPIVNHL